MILPTNYRRHYTEKTSCNKILSVFIPTYIELKEEEKGKRQGREKRRRGK